MERFKIVRDIGQGNFGVAKLLRDKKTKELFAVKYLDRGPKIDENVQREIINHRSLRHPHIIRFKEVCLTPQKLAIIMEYAAGGELFERICSSGRFSEDEQICHRDLKLENTLLEGTSTPRLKICDFGYSKSMLLHSQPKSTVGTPAYIAPEVLSRKEYDGKTSKLRVPQSTPSLIADVWSCGVTLYVMLVGAYPFEDPEDPKNIKSTINRILNVQYTIPDYVEISVDCRQLLSSIFVTNPAKRITIAQIKDHPWFRKNLSRNLLEGSEASYNHDDPNEHLQSVEDIVRIINEAKVPGVEDPNVFGSLDELEIEAEVETTQEAEGSGDFVCQV